MIAVNGRPCSRASLHVPWRGRWVASVAVDGDAPAGRVTITWGSATLVGSVEPGSAGTWQGLARARVVGGLGWSTVLPAKWLQNDAGLLGSSIAGQLATLAGETLTAPANAYRTLGTTYPRTKRAAAATLSDLLAADADWWVEYGGTTRAGVRPSLPAGSTVEILDLDPQDGLAQLDAEDVSQLVVGAVIAAAPPRRPQALRLVELRAEVGEGGQKFMGWLEAA